jgi:hypothetical protein
MVDISSFKVVDRDFTLYHTIAENESLKYNNKILLATGVVVGICFLGVAVYLINEEIHQRKYYY